MQTNMFTDYQAGKKIGGWGCKAQNTGLIPSSYTSSLLVWSIDL